MARHRRLRGLSPRRRHPAHTPLRALLRRASAATVAEAQSNSSPTPSATSPPGPSTKAISAGSIRLISITTPNGSRSAPTAKARRMRVRLPAKRRATRTCNCRRICAARSICSRLSLTLPAPQRAGAADELAQVNSHMASLYSTSRVEFRRPTTHARSARRAAGQRTQSRPHAGNVDQVAQHRPTDGAGLCAHGRNRQ